MRETSFGHMQVFYHENQRMEYLEFSKEGRFHQHFKSEYFTVLKGSGELITDKSKVLIVEGNTYSVLPNTPHRMKPTTQKLKILVSYGE